ncbi:hypothetical protein C5167_043660 [Papaver somniferum]|uniref:Uncharacterized protein n=1 Tax=Papaver somniferum TaxID=3469 RepID=A0A4Y7L806_PAPSO|nr:hypothetical protein C5167_043660 [Papaver somniferum]
MMARIGTEVNWRESNAFVDAFWCRWIGLSLLGESFSYEICYERILAVDLQHHMVQDHPSERNSDNPQQRTDLHRIERLLA